MKNINHLKKSITPITTGIFLLILSVLIVVIYIVKYKEVSFKESFVTTINTNDEGDPIMQDIDFNNSMFDILLDNNQYKMRLNEVKNELVDYENKLNKELLEQSIKDKKKAEKLHNQQQEKKLIEYKLNQQKEPSIIKSVKSNNNNQILSVNPVDLNNYQVFINDKCLTVYDDNKYLLDKCKSSMNMSDSQKFYTNRIYDIYNAKTVTGIQGTKIVEYPYNILKSKVTDHCLALDNNGISVTKCHPDDLRQHFKISEEVNECSVI